MPDASWGDMTTSETNTHAHPADGRHAADGHSHATAPTFGSWLGTDGVALAYARVDLPGDTGRVLVFLHGIGSYGGMYYHMAEGLTGAVDAVYFPDVRGHGRSGGRRGDLVSREQVLADIASMIACVHEAHADHAIVLAGESMGGLFALAYASKAPDSIDGLILAAPALKLQTRRFRTRDSIRRGWDGLMGVGQTGSFGEIPVTGGLPDEEPRDASFVRLTTTDPLILQSVSIKYLLVLWGFIWNWQGRYPRRLHDLSPSQVGYVARAGIRSLAGGICKRDEGPLPVLVLQGGADAVMDRRAARKMADSVPGGVYVEFPNAWHNLFSDPDSGEVLAVMREWLPAVDVAPPE
jgi:alpha-beta hydrolase superfamily lysophospholipase